MKGRDLIDSFGEIDEKYLEGMLGRKEARQEKRREQRQKGRVIMLKVGVAAAAAAAVFVTAVSSGMIRFGSGPAGPGVLPTNEELSTEIETTEGETAEIEVTESEVGSEEIQEKPESDDHCIIRVIGEGIEITALDGSILYEAQGRFAQAKAVYQKQNTADPKLGLWTLFVAGAESGTFQVLDDEMLWSINDPLPVVVPDENFSADRVSGELSFFNIMTGEWLMEPEHVNAFYLIGNGLWTDSEACFRFNIHDIPEWLKVGGPDSPENVLMGRLRRMDGSVVSPEKPDEEALYCQFGNCIVTSNSNIIRDLDGNEWFELQPGDILLDVLDYGYVAKRLEETSRTVVCDFDGNEIISERSGLTYRGHCGEYFNWDGRGAFAYIMPGIESLVTDRNLNIILRESEFFEKHPYSQLTNKFVLPEQLEGAPQDYCNIRVCGVTDDQFEIVLEQPGVVDYVFCSKDFTEQYPKKTIVLNENYTQIRYEKKGVRIIQSYDPAAADPADPDRPVNHDCREIENIPMREAMEEELEDYLTLVAMDDEVESFWIGDTEYVMSDKYFWSDSNGLCVFLEEGSRERVKAILDSVSPYWNTKILPHEEYNSSNE